MGLVNDEAHHVTVDEQPLHGLAAQHFRGDVEKVGGALGHLLNGRCPLDGVEQPVDGDGIADSTGRKVVNLVFHQ